MSDLARRTSPEIGPGEVLVVPVGSTEQHGPHLPLTTDTDIATALAARAADRCPGAVTAPAVAYGSAGEHADFPGTLSIGQEATELLLTELLRSAAASFAAVVLVSTHGGNAGPVARAVATAAAEGIAAESWSPAWPGDAHAGRTETSVLLALDPGRVRTDRLAPGDTRSLAELLPRLRTDGIRAVTPTGVLGDPTGATAAEGDQLLDAAVDQLADRLRTLSSGVAAQPTGAQR